MHVLGATLLVVAGEQVKFQKHSDGRTKENLGYVEVELWAKKRMGMQKTFF